MTMVESVGWVLVHFVWQGTAIALVLASLLALTSTAQATLRYALACAALTVMLMATVATAVTVITSAEPTIGETAVGRRRGSHFPATCVFGRGGRHDLERSADGRQNVQRSADPKSGRFGGPGDCRGRHAMGGCHLGGRRSVPLCQARRRLVEDARASTRRHRASSRVVSDAARESFVATGHHATGHNGRLSPRNGPDRLGHLKPVIVLPAAVVAGMNASQLEAIVAHELAHVRRHD